jgi:hypothetical protein
LKFAQTFEEDAFPIGPESMRRERAFLADDFARAIEAAADDL